MSRTRMKDIASQLGVSPSTVTRALKNDSHISLETKKKILAFAQENNYNKQPTKDRKNIYYLIEKSYFLFTSNFYNPLIEVIEQAVTEKGFEFHLSTINSPDSFLNNVNLEEVAGILMTSSYIEDILPTLSMYNIPVVLIDSYLPLVDTSAVVTDNQSGILKALEFLVKNGHKRIGYLTGELSDIDCADRYSGFKHGIGLFDLQTQPEDILNTKLSMSDSYKVMMNYLKNHTTHPTAFMGANDMVTIGAMSATKDAGYKVPEEMSFIGFDGLDFASEIVPSLTTIDVDRNAMGTLAVDRLLELMENKVVRFHKIMINPTLKKGNSVKNLTDVDIEKEEKTPL